MPYKTENAKENRKQRWAAAMTPTRIITLGFCLLILLGTLLLLLPIATREGQRTTVLDALFTATSATCVTGLIRFDTYTHWTLFGQMVILSLIQIGGIGFVTIVLSFAMLTGRRIGLNQRLLMQESVAAPQLGGMVKMTKFILLVTLWFEGGGALLLSFYFVPQFGWGQGIYFSIFHAISAFCNAGFDLMGMVAPGTSLMTLVGNTYVNLVIMGLIVGGGLGFFVWMDLKQAKFRFRHCKLHTKVVLVFTAGMILLGAGLLFLFERNGTLFQTLTTKEQILGSLFQSVTPRTAGFNTLPLNELSPQSKALQIFLMLVGGSSGSTAGGMKTTTVAILICTVYATLRQRKAVELFQRKIEDGILRTAVTVAVFYLTLSVCGALVISCLEPVSLMEALFETTSAIATVGTTLGITASVGEISQGILIFLMLVGRLGSVTFLLSLTNLSKRQLSQYPTENIQVG